MIVYSVVARGRNVLAEYSASSGNFPTITRVLLGKIPPQDGKLSYVYDGYVFHYIVSDLITYLCMAEKESRRRLPFAYLDEISRRFQATYGERAHTSVAFAMQEDFGRILHRRMDAFNGPDADSLQMAKRRIDDVKDVMVQSIETVLERGEKLELLVSKTDDLQHQAFRFEQSSKVLKNALFWKKVKIYTLGAAGLLLALYIISAMSCGAMLDQC